MENKNGKKDRFDFWIKFTIIVMGIFAFGMALGFACGILLIIMRGIIV